ncbi:MAG: ABC transporter permease subunit [Anaerolineales bacterium]|nr:ABC transporter permease subunit [Anaerolineales bacterium]
MSTAVASTVLSAPRRRPILWSLWIGALLVGLTLGLAWLGPELAPRDPLADTFIVRTGTGDFIRPPFTPGEVSGFPLGSDELGRDTLSRLMWGIRPTLTLALSVASVRLLLGLLIGLYSGWSTGPGARLAATLTNSALSVPVLFVALFVLALTGQRLGVTAFILGLSLTGWAEPARALREQTRLIRSERFIEAAAALGAGGPQTVLRHVAPHLLPMIWVLLALEVGGALLTSAGLGVLGYFPYAIWLQSNTSDFAAIRASGLPELSQMLVADGPWAAAFSGAVILTMVLGFNLLGDGLRQAFAPERRRSGWLERLAGQAGDRIFLALAEWERLATVTAMTLALVAIAGFGGWWLWSQVQSGAAGGGAAAAPVPGGHLWSTGRRDPYGTRAGGEPGPLSGAVAWSFEAEAPLFGPVVRADGTLLVVQTGKPATVIAVGPDGTEAWRLALPFELAYQQNAYQLRPVEVGTPLPPALTPDGRLVVLDAKSNVYIVSPEGELDLTWMNPAPARPVTAPIVSLEGTIYAAGESGLFALDPAGQLLWLTPLSSFSFNQPALRLSLDGSRLLFQNFIYATSSGRMLARSDDSFDAFVTGSDGQTYQRTLDGLLQWQFTETGATIVPFVRIDTRTLGLLVRNATDGGVSPSGRVWLYYGGQFNTARLVWADAGGTTPIVIDAPTIGLELLGLDGRDNSFWCGGDAQGVASSRVACQAYAGDGRILWRQELPSGTRGSTLGGAVIAGRLFVATTSGHLVAVGPSGDSP